MNKNQYKVLSSNYRALRAKNKKMSNRNFPIWSDDKNSYNFLMADYIVFTVFNDRVEFIGGRNVAPLTLY
jgi:hypothetical protein